MFRAATGEVLWTQALGAPSRAKPAAAGTHVYVLLDDGRVAGAGARNRGDRVGEPPARPAHHRFTRSTTGCSSAAPTGSSTAWRRTAARRSGAGEPARRSSAPPAWTRIRCTSSRSTACCGRSTAATATSAGKRPSRTSRRRDRSSPPACCWCRASRPRFPRSRRATGKPSGAAKLVGEPSVAPALPRTVEAGTAGRLLVIVRRQGAAARAESPSAERHSVPGTAVHDMLPRSSSEIHRRLWRPPVPP